MKKAKNTPPKPKEFASAPFSALKGVRPLAPEPPAVKVQKPTQVKQSEPDDMELFLLAMNGVERFGSKPRVQSIEQPFTPQKAVVRKIEESEQRLFLETISDLKLDVRFHDAIPEDSTTAKPSSISRIKQLRRGTIRLDYELDLHGLTRDEAIHALETFIKGAYRRGQQAVLVITGRGNHSPEEPVLKIATEKWLRGSGAIMVIEFFSAPRQFGGDGAVVVFLKKSPAIQTASESA